jgi:molybdenum cofactor cytidylyltransferase
MMTDTNIGVIVLAAGLSSRMGEFKLLLKWLDDQPLLAHVVEKVTALPVAPVVVVTGHRADAVRAALTGFDVTFAHNPDYADGEILSSMKVGLRAMPETVAAVMVVPGDMPRISQEVMQQVLNAHASATIVAPQYAGERGHPVLFDRNFWQALLDLPPDRMPRDVLRANKDHIHLIDVSSDGILADVDTPETYERELHRAQNNEA